MLPTTGLYYQIRDIPRIPEHFLDPKSVKIWWFSIAVHQATPDRRKTNTATQFTSPSAPQKRPTCSSCSRSTSQVPLCRDSRPVNHKASPYYDTKLTTNVVKRLSSHAIRSRRPRIQRGRQDTSGTQIHHWHCLGPCYNLSSRSMKQRWWNVSLAHSVIKSDLTWIWVSQIVLWIEYLILPWMWALLAQMIIYIPITYTVTRSMCLVCSLI